MPAAKNLIGQNFGRLHVVGKIGSVNGRVVWECICECGERTLAVSNALTSGHTKSCGCWRQERNASTETKHGHSRRSTGISPTYRTWQAMITRCENPNVKSYKDYGERGIAVCKEWKSFEGFLLSMGEKPTGTSIDRIDNEKGYEPSNCRWANKTEQNRNTRSNRVVTFDGRQITQAEFAELTGLSQSVVSYRLLNGWTVKQVAETLPYSGNRVASKLGDEVEIPE